MTALPLSKAGPATFKPIRGLLLDVDGVLTDGRIVYDDKGVEIKTFHVKDGLGIRLLMDAGIDVGIVTGRRSPALHRRCEDLGIQAVYEGVKDKAALLAAICHRINQPASALAFMGDDLPDIPIMKGTGLSVAVADAHPDVIARADLVTTKCGGQGAVREVCEAILKSQGHWENSMKRFV